MIFTPLNHNMKRSIPSISILSATLLTLSACGFNDITVKSKDGSQTTVKSDTTTSFTFDKQNAIESYDRWVTRIQNGLANCVKQFPNKPMCEDTYSKQIILKSKARNTISSMPDITIVKYQSINTAPDGKVSTSDIQYLACLPSGSDEDQSKWKTILTSVNELNQSKMGDLKFNTTENGTSMTEQLCKRYSSDS